MDSKDVNNPNLNLKPKPNQIPEVLYNSLNELLLKYNSNEYITGRIYNYIENILPSTLEQDEINYNQRQERKKILELERDEFTSKFLLLNKYYYTSQRELFLLYDGTHFIPYSEDDIQHQILTGITSQKSDKNLMVWKRKIKTNIIKLIKEKSPLNAIPESSTIQYVINSIYPSIFPSRNTAKYFLTIIGESINNSNNSNIIISPPSNNNNNNNNNNSNIYITSPILKQFITEINNQCSTFFGISNSLSNIKFKYYDHAYEKCRLINCNPINININNTNSPSGMSSSSSTFYTNDKHKILFPETTTGLIKNMIDLLCVASHYSHRYGSADNFLKQCSETKLIDHALYLHKNTLNEIVDNFINKTITPCISSKIYYKNMLFLFKKFLEERNVPNIAFHESLKTLFKEKFKYDDNEECFINITSTQLPIVSNFITFWDYTISEDSYDEEPELEIDEIITLFKMWMNKNKISVNHGHMNISETVLLELIRHFYPDIIIEDNKYLMHIKCSLWNKRVEILNSLALFKLKCSQDNNVSFKSLYEAYEFYSTNNKHQCMASKKDFEKIASDIIDDKHIDNDGIISPMWWK
jgi:hypothetical protein